jgi:superfamily II DNA or RNA helicase
MNNNTLLDNSNEELMMCNVLKNSISDERFNEIMIATGYWDLPGMTLILKELDTFLNRENSKLSILIGKEPLVRIYQQKNPQIRDNFPKEYIEKDINELDLKDEYQAVVNLLLQYCKADEINSKIKIRIYGQNEIEKFLHAKCYIFKGKGCAYGIIGSSNFTKKGLIENAELNYIETDYRCVSFDDKENPKLKGHIAWFYEKWSESKPWNNIFLEEILRKSTIGKTVEAKKEEEAKALLPNPFEIYIKHLQNNWGDAIDEWQIETDSFMPIDSGFKKLKYQTEAVNQGISIMKKHGGFILADVVGLGKTMVGVMIIKRFLIQLAMDCIKPKAVLIVTPPAIKQNWLDTIEYFDKDHDFKIKKYIQFITTGSIGKLVDDDNDIETDSFIEEPDSAQHFGLILIDESHKFKNSNTDMYKCLEKVIFNSQKPFIVLLSATPQNNRPDDIKNQIYLFQHERNNTTLDTIKDRKLDTYFTSVCNEYRNLIKSTDDHGEPKTEMQKSLDLERLKVISADLREKIINPLVVRRTRTDVEKYYREDIIAQGLKFPKIKGPIQLKYEMKERLAQLFFDTLEMIAPDNNKEFNNEDALGFYRYRTIEFLVKDEHKQLYEFRNLKVDATAKRLARIMQMLLVKRLESSFSAFRQSLHNMQQYCQNMIDMYNDNCVFICPDINVNAELHPENQKRLGREGCYTIIRSKIKNKASNNREFNSADLDINYIRLLKKDKQLIDIFIAKWDSERADPKLFQFIQHLENTFFDPSKNNPQNPQDKKLVIFSESIDTVLELKDQIESNTPHKVLAITSKNRGEMQETIQANFDANYKGLWASNYDIIITTEVLAEGINLHRSNTILNYDTPWNSTRLMQRIGRVNRIGSMADFVYVYNFFPSSHGDLQIDLVQKALTKLQSFHSLFGEDNQVFSTTEEVIVHDQPVFDMDDTESPSAKYIAALRLFKQHYPNEYKKIEQYPEGIHASRINNNNHLFCHVKLGNKDGLYYKVNREGCEQISTIEMAKYLECSIDEPRVEPGSDFNNFQQMAIAAFNDYRINAGSFLAADQNKIIKQARNIIIPLIRNNKSSTEVFKQKLVTARSLIEQGNIKLARAIIDLDNNLTKTLFNDGTSKLQFIENFVSRHLQNLDNANNASNLKPKIVLSLEA